MRDHKYPIMARKGSEPWWNEFLYARSVWFLAKWVGEEGIFSIWGRVTKMKDQTRDNYIDLTSEFEKISRDSDLTNSLLIPNVDEQNAKDIAKESLEQLHDWWGEYGYGGDSPSSNHSFFYSNATLVYIPFWEIDLRHEKLESKVVVLGTTGEIIYAEVPVT